MKKYYLKPSAVKANSITGDKIVNYEYKEDNSNKVTTLTGSSTNLLYPSAKCVYDIIGDLESILSLL